MAFMVNINLMLILIVLAVSDMTFAEQPGLEQDSQKTFYDDSKRGWFWYEVQPEPVEDKPEAQKQPEKPVIIPDMKDYTYETLWTMHPDRFQELLMQFQKKAVMTPSPQNVHDYLTMQDIARKKSLAFANTVSFVNQQNPQLSLTDDYPVAAPGRMAKNKLEQSEIDNTLMASAFEFALLYFLSPDCQFCQAQSQILSYFKQKYPQWQVKEINIQTNPDLAAQFNVQTVPHILLVYKHSDKAFPVATGVHSMMEIELNLYRAIKTIKGQITPQEWSVFEFQKGGSFDPVVKKKP